jgi:hypothetical protein
MDDEEEMAREEDSRAREEYEQTVAQWQQWEEEHGK